MTNDLIHLTEAGRQLGVAPATVSAWIKRLDIKTATLPDGLRVLKVADMERIREARAQNGHALLTSEGLKAWHKERRQSA